MGQVKGSTHSASVLLVEDNPITRRMMKMALDAEGYRVTEAPDASSALDAAARNLPDLVLQDLLLPDMSGSDLARRLRALPGASELPILALSGSTLPPEEDGWGDFSDHLVKPIEPSRVMEAVQAHLISRRAAPCSRSPMARKVRVLLVEDEQLHRRWIQLQLGQLGLEVTVASNGVEALALASETVPDVIVSDVLMPEMDGFQLCQRVRQEERFSHVRFVLTSSNYVDGGDGDLAIQFGADAIAPKTSELVEIVRALVETTRWPSATIAPPAKSPATVADRYGQVMRQMQTQASLRADAARSSATLAMVNVLLRRVAELSTRPFDIELALGELLAGCLDACGFGLGAVLLPHAGPRLRLGACLGDGQWSAEVGSDFFGYESWLRELTKHAVPVGWTVKMTPMPPIAEIAEVAGVRSMLLVPVRLGADRSGIMVLASRAPQLPPNWDVLARALQGPVAQGLALAQTVARLATSEQRFRGIAEVTGDGIIASDRTGRILYANPAAERMFGTQAADLAGASVRQLCATMLDTNGAQLINGLRRNGEQFPVELNRYTLEDHLDSSHYVHVFRDLSERHAIAELNRTAHRDPLTDVWNRRRFDEELRRVLAEARGGERKGGLLLVDIDQFKSINDTYGHPVGDVVLKRVATVLTRVTRDTDIVARLGGDEFAVLLANAEHGGAIRCAERILAELGSGEMLDDGQPAMPIGASIGIALFPAQASDRKHLFDCADQALYRSKRDGRNRATMYGATDELSPKPVSITRLRTSERSSSRAPRASGSQ